MLRLKEQNKKILIIVPTTSLVEQLTKDFGDYGWNMKNVQKSMSQTLSMDQPPKD